MRSRRTLDASLFALGVACWIARDDHGSRSHLGLLWGMLFDNVTVCAVLAFAGMTMSRGTEADDEVNPERAA